jgi:hypothetical protein
MSFFTAIAGWFHKQEASVTKVFSRIEPLLPKAETIVKDISAVTSALATADHSAVLVAIAKYLGTVTTDAGVVDSFITANTGAPIASVLHNAATLALSLSLPSTVAHIISDLDLAIQVAFSVTKVPPATAAAAVA